MANYSFSQLEDLWKQAGGNPAAAAVAAAVALAESSGNPDSVAHNGNGSTDRGLWQINSVHGAQSTFDPMANARAAIAISNNGSNWKPWCTAWTDGACGTKGGRFDPTGSSPSGRRLAPNGGGTVPPNSGGGDNQGGNNGGGNNGGAQQASLPLSADWWAETFQNITAGLLNFANHALFGAAIAIGGVSIVIGFIMILREGMGGVTTGIKVAGTAYKNVGHAALRRL